MNKKYKTINDWLRDKEYIKTLDFEDNYYLQELCKHIYAYYTVCPIPFKCTVDPKNNSRFFFSVAGNQFYLGISIDIGYYEYNYLLNQKLKKYFPQYNVTQINKRKYTQKC